MSEQFPLTPGCPGARHCPTMNAEGDHCVRGNYQGALWRDPDVFPPPGVILGGRVSLAGPQHFQFVGTEVAPHAEATRRRGRPRRMLLASVGGACQQLPAWP